MITVMSSFALVHAVSAVVVDADPLSTGDIITIVSVLIAGIGVFFGARYAKRQLDAAHEQLSAAREQLEAGQAQLVAGQAQLKRQTLTARGQFLLSLHERFREHDPIHLRLRSRSTDFAWWADDQPTRAEWAAVEAYMGLFERVWVLVKDGSIDIEVIDRLYGYRVRNIVKNDRIRAAKLENSALARDWVDFIELWRALDDVHRSRLGTDLWAGHPAPAPPYPFDAPFVIGGGADGEARRLARA
jgi:hypothetical protein